MSAISTWPLAATLAVFVVAAVATTLAGIRLAGLAEALAYRTGLGQAVAGALFLGLATSLSGLATSLAAAAAGHAELAIANAAGGIATQTVFLAIADIRYESSNLEHAAASMVNMSQAVVLIGLLCLLLLATIAPEFQVLGIHPITPLLFVGYVLGVRLATRTRKEPMWHAKRTHHTRTDFDEKPTRDARGPIRLWLTFILYAGIIATAGWMLAGTGVAISMRAGIDQTLVGGVLTATVTSAPELVTALAAVRRGAVNLAVGDIIGGNVFDTLFAAAADVVYREGSIFHAIGARSQFLLTLTILMTSVLVLGMIRREPSGIANIGFESMLVLALYGCGIGVLLLW